MRLVFLQYQNSVPSHAKNAPSLCHLRLRLCLTLFLSPLHVLALHSRIPVDLCLRHCSVCGYVPWLCAVWAAKLPHKSLLRSAWRAWAWQSALVSTTSRCFSWFSGVCCQNLLGNYDSWFTDQKPSGCGGCIIKNQRTQCRLIPALILNDVSMFLQIFKKLSSMSM